MIFISLTNANIFELIQNYLTKIRRSNEEGLFCLFDSYFNMLTNYISPLAILSPEGELVLGTLDNWALLWKTKGDGHDSLGAMDEPMATQLDILIYQITNYFDLDEHNDSSLEMLKKMCIVLTEILMSMDKKSAKALYKKVKTGMSELLGRFVGKKIKKSLNKAVEGITEVLVDFLNEFEAD